MTQLPCDRYYCPKCDRWFQPHEIRGGTHKLVIVTPSGDIFHVVLPEPEALALLRERGK